MLATDCPVIHVRGNMYYAPVLEANTAIARAARWLRMRGLACSAAAKQMDDGARARDAPFFAAVSRHFFVPHPQASLRADVTIANVKSSAPGELRAVIGVHVRSTILLALHKERHANVTSDGVMRAYGFLDCIALVRNKSQAAGFAGGSRVYLAADNPQLRQEALRAFPGPNELVQPPDYLYTGRESRGKMTTVRGAVATSGAIDEMLLLSRLDGLIVWDLKDSTFSAAAASWGTHLRTRSRPWLGVHLVAEGCACVKDSDVEPATHPA